MPEKKEIQFEQPSFLLLFFNKYVTFIIIFIVVFILVGSYLFLFVPKIEAIKNIKKDNTATDVKRTTNEAILTKIKVLDDDYNKIKEERKVALAGLKKLIPNEPQVAELFVMLEKICLDNGFVLNTITVSGGEDDGTDNIKTAGINISVTYVYEEEENVEDLLGEDGAIDIDAVSPEEKETKTTYEAFKQFLEALENNLRLMDISTVSFGSLPVGVDGNPAAGSTNFMFTLNTYFQ